MDSSTNPLSNYDTAKGWECRTKRSADKPVIFYSRTTGQIGGVLPSASDAVKVRAQDLNCAVEHKCLVLDVKTSRTVVMQAGDAIGLEPSQFVLLEALPFDSLRCKSLGKRHQRHVDQGQLRGVKQVLMRLAFWRI